jgi:Response regulator containing CheY-like receiver and SARP domains
MLRIAAVDDEMHALQRFKRMVVKIKELELCGLFESGEELLAYLKEHPLDAIFLDIEMPDVNGLQLCEQVLDLNENIDIIFVTAFNQYAVEAFELQAIDYIMKPFTEERFHKTVRRLLKTQKTYLAPRKPFIQCFGDFEVFLDGEAIQWKNSKAKEILAFLVHKEGVPVNGEKIADAVWPEYDAQKSKTNFHANTYLLRRRLAEAGISQILENSRGNYRVITEEVDCDLYELKKIVKGNHIKSKEEYALIERLSQKEYMEENGYSWTYSRAVQLDEICKISMDNFKENK